mgnify:CR=1 FL=1
MASEEIVNALFGYGSFTIENINMTALALKFFGYGVPAFALVKILSNFFFARNNTKFLANRFTFWTQKIYGKNF